MKVAITLNSVIQIKTNSDPYYGIREWPLSSDSSASRLAAAPDLGVKNVPYE